MAQGSWKLLECRWRLIQPWKCTGKDDKLSATNVLFVNWLWAANQGKPNSSYDTKNCDYMYKIQNDFFSQWFWILGDQESTGEPPPPADNFHS